MLMLGNIRCCIAGITYYFLRSLSPWRRVAALGHFLSVVIHDSMMGLDTPLQVGVNLDGNNGGMLTFHMPF